MARGKSERSRTESSRKEKPVTLIVCEGETEYRYFMQIRQEYRAMGIRVVVSDQSNPLGVLACAKRKKRELQKKGLRVTAWIVLDAESVQFEKERHYRDALIQSDAAGICVANSSPCFEYWMLLHFSAGDMVMDPKQALSALRRPGRLPSYKKPDAPFRELWPIYRSGVPSTAALRRREAIESDGEDPRFGRPVTYVDVLVDQLVKTYEKRLPAME